MDGNGRWAKKRFLPRVAGHRRGVEAVRATVQACAERGVEYLTLFAFSSRELAPPGGGSLVPDAALPRGARAGGREAARERHPLARDRRTSRRSARRSRELIAARRGASPPRNRTAHAHRSPPTTAAAGTSCRRSTACAREQPERAGSYTEARPDAATSPMSYAPEPDLFIRTGGEQRISNFLLWQLAYTELYFTDTPVAGLRRAPRSTRPSPRTARASGASAARASSSRRLGSPPPAPRPARRAPQAASAGRAMLATASSPRSLLVAALLAALFLAAPARLDGARRRPCSPLLPGNGAASRALGPGGRDPLRRRAARRWRSRPPSVRARRRRRRRARARAGLRRRARRSGSSPRRSGSRGGLRAAGLRSCSPRLDRAPADLARARACCGTRARARCSRSWRSSGSPTSRRISPAGAFGRRKLAPAISPGKTWEGVAGALLRRLVYAVAWIALPRRAPGAVRDLPGAAAGCSSSLAALARAVASLGDLFESCDEAAGRRSRTAAACCPGTAACSTASTRSRRSLPVPRRW